MCKTYVVLNLNKTAYNPVSGKLSTLNNGSSYTASYYDSLAGAQAQADALARGGTLAVIYEAKEFRQIQPAPVVIQRVECCDPK